LVGKLVGRVDIGLGDVTVVDDAPAVLIAIRSR
jgi:hypothetical protein